MGLTLQRAGVAIRNSSSAFKGWHIGIAAGTRLFRKTFGEGRERANPVPRGSGERLWV